MSTAQTMNGVSYNNNACVVVTMGYKDEVKVADKLHTLKSPGVIRKWEYW